MRPFEPPNHDRAKHNYTLNKNIHSLISVNQNKPGFFCRYEDLERPDNEKICKKYYSKKLNNLLIFHKSSPNASMHRCKTLKSLKVYGSSLRRGPILSAKTLTLYYATKAAAIFENPNPDKEMTSHSIADQLSGYKLLKSLSFYGGAQIVLLRQIKTLKNLQNLTLTLNRHQLIANSSILLSLRYIKSFRLTLVNSMRHAAGPFEEETIEFCVALIASKELQYLGLALGSLSFEGKPELLDLLLGSLNQGRITSFNLGLNLPKSLGMDIENLQTTFNSLDHLSLRANFGTIVINKKDNNILPSSQRQKKLEIGLPMYVDLTHLQMYNQYNQLQPTRLIESLNSLFSMISEPHMPILNALQVDILKSFTFIIPSAPRENYGEISEGLACVLKESPNLRHFTLSNFKINCAANSQTARRYMAVFNEISQLNKLDSLHIDDLSIADGSFGLLERALAPLSNLKSLHLFMKVSFASNEANLALSLNSLVGLKKLSLNMTLCQVIEQLNLSLSFEALQNLKELHVKLPNLNQDSQFDFVRNLMEIWALEELNFNGGTQFMKYPKLRSSLFKVFYNLPKLKTVNILPGHVSLRSVLQQKEDTEGNRILAEEIREEVDSLFYEHKNIEKFFVEHHGCYEIKATK